MKKLLTFLMMFTLFFGVGWAETGSYTLTFSNNANGATALTNTTQAKTVLNSDSRAYVLDLPFAVNSGNVYYGDTKTCIRIGKSGKASKLTVYLSDAGKVNATNIAVKCNNTGGSNNSNATLKVNGSSAQTTTDSEATYNFALDGSTISSIILEGSASIRIYEITVTYTTGGSSPTTVEAPTFSGVTNNATVTEDVALSMTTATDGASISYATFSTVQNNIETSHLTNNYSGSAVNFTENGDYIVYAAAYKSGTWSSISSIKFTVNKSTTPPTPSTSYYEKVTTAGNLPSGEYLIVYEEGSVAFNGGLSTLDAANNNISVTISDNKIASSATVDAATFTWDATAGTLKSASGFYIGQTNYDNGMKSSQTEAYTNTIAIDNNGDAVITSSLLTSSHVTLRYNNTSGNYRFRYYKSGQQAIQIYKKVQTGAHSVAVADGIEHGTVSVSPSSANADDVITVTATPATGYKLTALAYNDNAINITNTPYQFTMPDEDVTVTATFSQINYNIYRTVKTNDETSTAGGWLGRWNENCTLPDGATGDSYVVTANYGASIQFMAGTNNNYEILPENITAVDADGNPVSLNVADSYTTIDNDYGRLVTFTMPASPVTITANFTSYVSELYILGTANGNSWAGNLGVKMDKGGTDDAYYTARVYFAGNATDGAYGYFNFTESLGNADWSNMGTRYGSKNGEHYDLEAHGWTGEMNWWDEHKEQSFKVPAGIYDIVVNKVKGQVTVTRVEPEFTFSPAAGEVLEGTTVTATSNLGDLLYAIDSNVAASAATTQVSLSENGTYTDNVTLDADGNVYAHATYGQITYTSAPAAYTVEEVDMNNVYVLVEDADDLVAGEDYLIARSNGEAVLGAIASGNYGTSVTEGFAYNPTAKTITLQTNCDATPLTLGGEENAWTFYNGTQYLALTGDGNSLYGVNTISTNNSQAKWTISITNDGTNILNNEYTTREIRYNSGQPRFACYNGTQNAVALFKKAVSKVVPPSFSVESGEVVARTQVTITAAEGCTLKYTVNNGTEQTTTSNTATVTINEATTIVAKAVDGNNNESEEATATYTVLTTTTLADLEANPEQGKSYVISDVLTVAYVAADGTAYAKDADQALEVPAGAHDYVATQLTDRSHTNKTANWIAITGIDEVDEGQTIAANTLRGTLTDAVNFTLAVSQQPELSNDPVEYYDVNTYIPCNFMGQSTQTGTNGQTYFFSTPQVNEFAHITNAVLASKTSGTSGEAGTYTMTIDGNDNGNKDVHWTSDATSLTWDEITWNTSITWQKSGTYFNNGKEFAQIGSKSNPAATISMSTTGFGGKRITGVSFRASCTNTDGPTLTVTAGSQTLLTDIPILKSTDAGEDTYSTNSANVMMGENDALTFTINSSAAAGLYIYSLSVTYDDATGATGTFNLGTGAGVNTAGLSGEITVDLGSLGDSFNVGQMYTFDALIKTAASGNGAPRRVAGNGNYSIQAVGNVSGNDIPTAVDELQSGKAVDGVRYVNVAGQVAATPWQGVNIVVTRYTDGSTRTTKVVK